MLEYLDGLSHALRPEEVSELLSIPLSSVYRKVRSGQLPAFSVGASVRFDPRQLAQWLRTKTSANELTIRKRK